MNVKRQRIGKGEKEIKKQREEIIQQNKGAIISPWNLFTFNTLPVSFSVPVYFSLCKNLATLHSRESWRKEHAKIHKEGDSFPETELRKLIDKILLNSCNFSSNLFGKIGEQQDLSKEKKKNDRKK